MPKETPTRLNVNISPKLHATLERLKNEREMSYTELVRTGINLMSWLDEQEAQGNVFVVRGPDGKERQIKFLI